MKRWLPALVISLLVLAPFLVWYGPRLFWTVEAPIRVGILHSRSGATAASELAMIDGELMAIDEINRQGGVLGRKVEVVEADGRSDPSIFAAEARRLIETEGVDVIFGCGSPIDRKRVEAVVGEKQRILFYPGRHEGMYIPNDVITTGPLPNQQVIPAISWCVETLGAKKLFLAGSRDILSYTDHAIIREQARALGVQVVGEKFIGLDDATAADVAAAIKASRPEVVVSTIVGEENQAFYQSLARAGLTASQTPVVSLTISEQELRDLPIKDLTGHYAAWPYLESIETPANRAFVQRFRARYSMDRSPCDATVAAYNAVYFWARAVEEARSDSVPLVWESLRRASLNAPEGVVSIDWGTICTWRPIQIGKIQGDGRFTIVWSSLQAIRPNPFPVLKTRSEWTALVDRFFSHWGTKDFRPEGADAPAPSPSPPPSPSPANAVSGRRPAARPPATASTASSLAPSGERPSRLPQRSKQGKGL
jgi:urea transport system substrate-binding protein